MKKITLISLLLTLSVLTLKAQSYNSKSKEVRYEPDTIVVYDLDGYDEIVLSMRETYAYNELGLLITREMNEWNPQKNEYTNENAMRTTYTYNDDNLRESEVSMYWNNETNNWLNQIKMEYEYSGNLPISVTHSYWNDSTNTFNSGDKYIFVYDEHNNMVSSIIQSWDGS
ncbi:MAG: DUF3836 domain-containing protein, partial [Bacteroidales bacterium]|nr:DUF3836 domain-containing protein [Bacteroidales bacterium]